MGIIFPVNINDLITATEVLKVLWTEDSCNKRTKIKGKTLPFSAELNGFNNFPVTRVITWLFFFSYSTVLNY